MLAAYGRVTAARAQKVGTVVVVSREVLVFGNSSGFYFVHRKIYFV